MQQHLPASKSASSWGRQPPIPGLSKVSGGTWAALGVLCGLEFIDPPLSLSNEQTPSTRVQDEARSPAEDGSLPQQGKAQGIGSGSQGTQASLGLSPPSRPRVPVAVRDPRGCASLGLQGSLPGSGCHRTRGTEPGERGRLRTALCSGEVGTAGEERGQRQKCLLGRASRGEACWRPMLPHLSLRGVSGLLQGRRTELCPVTPPAPPGAACHSASCHVPRLSPQRAWRH